MKKVYFKKLDPRATIPQYMTPNSAGMDLSIILNEDLYIPPEEVRLLRTGLAVVIPHNMEGQIRPRSGLSMSYPNYIANSPGTIDSDYRGEIKIPFVNNTRRLIILGHGERIAQIIFSRVVHADISEIEEFETNTMRSDGGFGHTGL
jgi:dUTP pyrophosphatase